MVAATAVKQANACSIRTFRAALSSLPSPQALTINGALRHRRNAHAGDDAGPAHCTGWPSRYMRPSACTVLCKVRYKLSTSLRSSILRSGAGLQGMKAWMVAGLFDAAAPLSSALKCGSEDNL